MFVKKFSIKLPIYLIVISVLTFTSSNVSASLDPGFLSYGDVIYNSGQPPADLLEDNKDFAGWELGYFCQHFSVLWASILSYDCELVIYQEATDTYAEIELDLKNELMQEFSFDKTNRSIWNQYGRFAVILLFIIGMFMKKDEEE